MAEGDQQAHKNRVDALSIFSMAAASLLVTIGGYVINDHGNIDRIEAKPSASPHAFPEADGRRLEAMISDLQRQIYHTPKSEK